MGGDVRVWRKFVLTNKASARIEFGILLRTNYQKIKILYVKA